MVRDRLSLHSKLVELLGSSKVYYQPPASVKLEYPCIIYNLDDVEVIHANNRKYLGHKRYLLTIVSRDPDPEVLDKVLGLELSKFEDPFVINNLYHYICSLYW